MAEGRKRLNPETGKPFKMGDTREDGYVFKSYQPTIRKTDGYFMEAWRRPEALKKQIEKDLKRRRKKRALGSVPSKKRINPLTNKFYVTGDTENGLVFYQYRPEAVGQDGYASEEWVSTDVYSARKSRKRIKNRARLEDWEKFVRARLASIKGRALTKKLQFNLDVKYMMDIYPADGKCPVFGFHMDRIDSKKFTSPSVDRVDNTLGYIKGNVAWISMKANSMKSDHSLSDLQCLVDFMNRFQQGNQHE